MRDLIQCGDCEILAMTLWGEARGESIMGRAAIASVVINRVNAKSWFGDSIKDVCLKPFQFSVWNPGDPNREKMLDVDDNDPNYRECWTIAELAEMGLLTDCTANSTHYHTAEVQPDWSQGKRPVRIIGRHHFFNNVS